MGSLISVAGMTATPIEPHTYFTTATCPMVCAFFTTVTTRHAAIPHICGWGRIQITIWIGIGRAEENRLVANVAEPPNLLPPREIRASGDTNKSLGRLYGVSHVQIWRIRNGKKWRPLGSPAGYPAKQESPETATFDPQTRDDTSDAG
jgi:hypothetical protein